MQLVGKPVVCYWIFDPGHLLPKLALIMVKLRFLRLGLGPIFLSMSADMICKDGFKVGSFLQYNKAGKG